MAESVGGIYYDIEARTDGLIQGQRAVKRSTDSIQSDFQRIEKSSESAGFAISKMAAAISAALSVQKVVTYSNAWTDLNSRIRNVVGPGQEAADVMERIADIANRSFAAIENTTEAYLRNADALRQLGFNTDQTLEFTEALALGLVVSGAKAQRAESVTNALSKALASGALRGDNFNTVIESGGVVAEALAKGLGVGTLELRKMAEAGELTSDRVIPALISQLDTLREQAEAMPVTIGDAFTILNNKSMEMIGTFMETSGVAGAASDAILMLANNLDNVASLAAIVATAYGSKVAAGFITATFSAIRYQLALASMAGVSATAAAGQLALASATRAASTAMAFIGGPAGLAIISAVGIGLLTKRYIENTAEIEANRQKLIESQKARTTETAIIEAQNRSLQAGANRLKAYEDAQKQAFANSLAGASQAKYQETFDRVSKSLELAERRLQVYTERQGTSIARMNEARAAVKKYQDQLEVLKDFVPTLTTTEQQAAEALAKVTQGIEDQIFKLREGEQAYDIMIAQRNAGVTAMSEEGKAIASLIRLRDQEKAAIDATAEARRQAAQDAADFERQLIADTEKEIQNRKQVSSDVRFVGVTDQQAELTRLADSYMQQQLLLQTALEMELITRQEYADRRLLLEQQTQEQINQINQQGTASLKEQLDSVGFNLDTFQNQAIGAFAAVATGAMSGKDAIRGLAQSILTTAIGALIKMAVTAAIGQKAAVATGAATAGALSAAYATPAALASLASFGANAAPASAGIASTVALSQGLALGGGRLNGGPVRPGMIYPVTEDGRPEILMSGGKQYLLPGSRGEVVSNKDMGRAGGSNVTVNVINNASGTKIEEKRSQGPDGAQMIEIIVADIQQRGKVHNAITNTTTAGNRI